MKLKTIVRKLKSKRYYYLGAILIFILSVFISSLGSKNYTFPNSSYSNLGNPENSLGMFFNVGFILSIIFISIYVRFITIKLFKHSEIFRISYIIPIISAIFIGLFPQQEGKELHGLAVLINIILLAVLTPINFVGLWQRSKKLLLGIVGISLFFSLIISLILFIIPFNWKELGLLETSVILYILSICVLLDVFIFRKRKFST